MYYDLDILTEKIKEWGEAKGFVKKENTFTQMTKLSEEQGELASALLKNDPAEIVDAIGDIYVVLTLLAEMQGFDIKTCIYSAYMDIKDRTGNVKDGTFIKDK